MNKNNREYKKVWRFKFEKWYNSKETLIEIFPVVGFFWDEDSYCVHCGWLFWEFQIWRIETSNISISSEVTKIIKDNC